MFSNPHTTPLPNLTRRRFHLFGLLAAVLAVGVATLAPIPEQAPRSALTAPSCIICGDTGGADLIRNVLLFIPLGLALAASDVRWRTTLAAGAGLSLLVEALQFTVIPGRDAALGDLVANAAGALAGWAVWRSRSGWASPSPRAARLLAGGWLALGGALAAFGWWGLAPDLPEGVWYAQWSPDRPRENFFSGRLISLRLGDTGVPHWRIPDDLTRQLRTTSREVVRLEARIVRGPREREELRIASLASGEHRFLSLGTAGDDLLFSIRTRGARLRLLSPRFRLPDGLAAAATDSLTLVASYARGVAEVASIGQEQRQMVIRLTPLDTWVFLGLGTVPGPAGLWLLRAATLAALFGPLGFWLRLGYRTR